jgi:hypothetical protein
MKWVMGSYAIQLWLQSIRDMMLGLGCNQNKYLHVHKVATKGKLEVRVQIWTSIFFKITFIGISFHILVM